MRHLTNKHPYSEIAQNTIRDCKGIPVVVNILKNSNSIPVRKAIVGLIRNIALCKYNLPVLHECQGLSKLTDILLETCLAMNQRMNGNPVREIDGIRLEDIIESTVGALHVVSKDSQYRGLLTDSKCIRIFSQVLLDES